MNDENFNNFDEDEIVEESYDDNSFDNSSSNREKIKTWIIVGAVSLATFILVFALTNKIINNNKKESISTPTIESEKFDAYKVGDTVTLKDGSNWHVLYESKDTSEYLTLLNDDDVNKDGILYGNINSFLKGSYKTELVKSLECQSTDIQEIRLFAYLDLAEISKANSADFKPGKMLSDFNFPDWISSKTTVTDTVYQTETSNSPVMICTKDINNDIKAKNIDNDLDVTINENLDKGSTIFCLGDNTVSLPVRPVIVISKKILKTTDTKISSEANSENN